MDSKTRTRHPPSAMVIATARNIVHEIEAVLRRNGASLITPEPAHLWVKGHEAGTIDNTCGGVFDLEFTPSKDRSGTCPRPTTTHSKESRDSGGWDQ